MNKGYLIQLTATFCGSFYYVFYKIGLKDFTPETFTFLLFCAGLFTNLVPIALKKDFKINRATWIAGISFGLLSFVANILNGYSLSHCTPAVTVVLLRSQTFMVMLMGALFLHEKITKPLILGAIIGLTGIAIIASAKGDFSVSSLAGVIYALLAALGFAVSQIIHKYYIKDMHPFMVNFIRMVIAVVMGFILIDDLNELKAVTPFIIVLAFFTSLSGHTLSRVGNMFALRYIPASRASFLENALPIFTLIVGLILLNEIPTLTEIIGGIVLIAGLLLPFIVKQFSKGKSCIK